MKKVKKKKQNTTEKCQGKEKKLKKGNIDRKIEEKIDYR